MILLVLSLLLVLRTGYLIETRDTGVEWPSGKYGLPKPLSGCPRSKGSVWHEGWRFQDMEDDEDKSRESRSKLSSGSHMDLKFHGDKIDLNRTFCMKQTTGIQTRFWPKGSYCIYKSGDAACPKDMSPGWVKWDDEDYKNKNKKGGSLPDGSYNDDTVIDYCCQIQGNWHDSIELPVVQPFYLLTSSSTNTPKCQMVKWAFSNLEYIVFDTNDQKNSDSQGGDHVLMESGRTVYYCYYKACRHKMTEPSGSFKSHPAAVNRMDPHSQYCSWLITIAESYIISLTFKELTITDCSDKFLRIYDGSNDTTPLLGTYCGVTASTDVKILSSRNNLYIVSNSGSHHNQKGSFMFHAQYNAEHSKGCHHEVIGNTGYIQSPVFDISGDYPRHPNCSWLVTVGDAYLVTLNFTLLKLSKNDDDIMEVYDGDNENAPVLARYSSQNSDENNGTLVSCSKSVYIILKYGLSSKHQSCFAVDYASRPKPTDTFTPFREALTKMSTASTSIYTVKTQIPDSESVEQSEGTPTMYIIVAVVVCVCIILILIAIVIFLRRRRKKTETSSVLHEINPSYSWRRKTTTDADDDSVCYANPSSPQEKVWISGNSKVCKESKNPIYERTDEQEPAALYSSTDATYEPLVENNAGAAESSNPLYDGSGVTSSHVYAEPSSPKKSIIYDEPDLKI